LDVLLLGAGRQRIVHAVNAPQVGVGIDIAEVVGECGLARGGNGKVAAACMTCLRPEMLAAAIMSSSRANVGRDRVGV